MSGIIFTKLVKNIPLGKNHGGKREIEFEVPEPQTIDDFISFYGSEAEFISRNQKYVARAAVQNAYVKLTNAANDTPAGAELEALISKAQEACKTYRPETTGDVTQKELVSNAKGVLALDDAALSNMSAADVLALLRGEK
jgi:hypothetical protein